MEGILLPDLFDELKQGLTPKRLTRGGAHYNHPCVKKKNLRREGTVMTGLFCGLTGVLTTKLLRRGHFGHCRMQ